MFRLFSLFACSIFAFNSFAIRYYVNGSATGSGTGLNWTNAFNSIQEALSLVTPGDEIWVAAGQYKTTASTDRSISFSLRNGVDLYGSFAGYETSVDQRDIANNPTTLNGDIGELGQSSDNTHTLVTANNITTTIQFDGFRLINGYNTSSSSGGGARITNALGGEVIIKNCAFLNNYSYNAAGAIYVAASNLTIEDCEFNNNSAGTGGNGGAINTGNNNNGRSTLHISNSLFINNVGRIGACLYNSIEYQELIIDRCIFTNNTASISIIYIKDFAEAKILNSLIVGNTIDDFSGNVLFVDAFASDPDQHFELINTTIAHNYNLYENTIQDNIVRLQDSFLTAQNCIIYGNSVYDGRQINTAPMITNSIIEGGHANGTNIVDMDPLFIGSYVGTPSNFDGTAYNYHPQPASPAINTGDNAFVYAGYELDLDGNTRIQGMIVDLGCYESDLNVSVGDEVAGRADWYFDAPNNLLCISNPVLATNEVVSIYDVTGKLQATFTLNRAQTSIALPAGVYVAKSDVRKGLKFLVR